jgi:hypothetical protein
MLSLPLFRNWSWLFLGLLLLGISCQNPENAQKSPSLPLELTPADLSESSHRRMAPFSFRNQLNFQGELNGRPFQLNMTIMDSLVSGEGNFEDTQSTLSVAGHQRWQAGEWVELEVQENQKVLGTFLAQPVAGMRLEGEWQPRGSKRVSPMRWTAEEQVIAMPPPVSQAGEIIINRRELDMRSPDSMCLFRYEYPKFSGFASLELNRRINQLVGLPSKRDMQARMGSCAAEAYEMGEGWKQELLYSYQVHLFTPELMSVSMISTVTETAYDKVSVLEQAQLLNIDPRTGQVWENDQLFVSDFSARLTPMIEQWLKQQYAGDLDLEYDKIESSQAFAFHPGHLVVRFDPYTLGEFMPKPISLTFPYAEVKDLFLPIGPVSRLMQ